MRTKAELLAMGFNAPISEVLATFGHGNLGSFAQKELPKAREMLGVKTIGELASYSRSEISGPRACYAGNKTLSWLETVLSEFGCILLSEPHPEFDLPRKADGTRM